MSAIFSLIGRTAAAGAKAATSAGTKTTKAYQAILKSQQAAKAAAKLPPKITKAAQAAKDAAKAAAASGTVKTAAKVATVGGAVGVAGLLAGAGIDAAVVKPFKELGLVTTDAAGKVTGLTQTGKAVAIGLLLLAGIGAAAYFARAAK